MKKFMIAAMIVLSTSSVFAKDSDALKAILSAKTFTEAQALVNSSLSQLVTNEEKAKAYNKLVDLAMEKVNKEQAIIDKNAVNQQLGKSEQDPYDVEGYNNAINDAFVAALECEKYDVMPNEKGKVKPKFHKSNQERLFPLRVQLINAGQEAGNKENKEAALKHFGMYVDTHTASLFSDVANKPAYDQYIGEVARFAAVYAFQNKNIDLAHQYVDVALQDTSKTVHQDALGVKSYLLTQGLSSKADSLKAVDALKELYVKENGNDQVFLLLGSMYTGLNDKPALDALIAEKLNADANNFSALSLKGQTEMNENKIDEAIVSFKKAVGVNDKDALILTYLGFCLNAKAASLNLADEQNKLYTESMGYLEKAKQIDPNKEKVNWSYPLYQCYYSLYGADDARTKEMENMNK